MKLYKGVSRLQMMDGRRRVWEKERGRRYRVYGREGRPYDIQISQGVPLCPCAAGSGQADGRQFPPRACWHATIVLMRLQREKLAA